MNDTLQRVDFRVALPHAAAHYAACLKEGRPCKPAGPAWSLEELRSLREALGEAIHRAANVEQVRSLLAGLPESARKALLAREVSP